MQDLQPQPTIWETNPKLKRLLVVLIFVFLFSGIGLVVFSQWSNSYREQVYEETVNGLPKHEVVLDVAGWQTYKNDKCNFQIEYPDGVLISKRSDVVIFTDSKEQIGLDKIQTPIYDQLNLSVGCDLSKTYTDTKEYISKWSYNDPNTASLWNFTPTGFIEINGVSFYKYNWTHQVQSEVYITVNKNILFNLEISSGDTIRALADFKKYSIFKKIISTFKFTK